MSLTTTTTTSTTTTTLFLLLRDGCSVSFRPKNSILLPQHHPTPQRLKCSIPTTSMICLPFKQKPSSSKGTQGGCFLYHLFNSRRTFRASCSQPQDAGNLGTSSSDGIPNQGDNVGDKILEDLKIETSSPRSSFLAKLALALGIAATVTLISVGSKWPTQGSPLGVPFGFDGSSTSAPPIPLVGFSFKVFGHPVVLPQYAPGWVYFWLLMAAGCGLFISEEALNIWVCPLYWSASP